MFSRDSAENEQNSDVVKGRLELKFGTKLGCIYTFQQMSGNCRWLYASVSFSGRDVRAPVFFSSLSLEKLAKQQKPLRTEFHHLKHNCG